MAYRNIHQTPPRIVPASALPQRVEGRGEGRGRPDPVSHLCRQRRAGVRDHPDPRPQSRLDTSWAL
jgi:hypothetical protein